MIGFARERDARFVAIMAARDELGITESQSARPVQAAAASAVTFISGAAIPVVLAALIPREHTIVVVVAATLCILAILGGLAAKVGGAPLHRATMTSVEWCAATRRRITLFRVNDQLDADGADRGRRQSAGKRDAAPALTRARVVRNAWGVSGGFAAVARNEVGGAGDAVGVAGDRAAVAGAVSAVARVASAVAGAGGVLSVPAAAPTFICAAGSRFYRPPRFPAEVRRTE